MEDSVEKWREALEEASCLAGWELKNMVDGHESKFIQKIVEEISLELRSVNFSVDEKLIGMETRIKDVVSSLEVGFDDVCMVGIKGIGGGGKTTLARAVFDQISILFEGKIFVENVREVSKASLSGLKSLQKQILSDVLNDQGISVNNVYDGKNMMKKVMCSRKVLVVLDDVDHIDQLKALAGEPNWFKKGSRIIVTTRDEQVLVAHGVKWIHNVNLLSNKEAICLFSRYAFGREIPIQGYEDLSGQVVGYAAGLPLTITVLGSFLCGKSELEWRDVLERLETIPLKETLEKLELSYMGLEEDYKEIFLDVACILKGWEKVKAIRVLESCGFHARIGLRVLEQKSLIAISEHGYLGMHDHIEEMGRNIVRRLHLDEPNKHSRLWISEEIEDVLANDLGTEATRCIQLLTSKLDPEIVMKGFGNMKKLRFLHVYSKFQEDFTWKFDEVSQYFPNALRYLSWKNYSFESLPKTFQANNLVALEMNHSKIVQLWEGGERKVLKKLKFLHFDHSKLKSLDLGLTPNLETLNISECYDLVELHIPTECLKLRSLYINHLMSRTVNLVQTPNLGSSKLRTLDLRGATNIETISLRGCYDLVELHIPIECLKLESIDIMGSKLRTFNLRRTPNLKTLSLKECYHLVELHISVECMKLISFDLNHSKWWMLDLRAAPNLKTLSLVECVDLVELHNPVECLKLTSLDLDCYKLRILDLRGTLNVETISLVECADLVELHIPVECLKLKSLDLGSSKLRTLDLRGASNLETLNVRGCYDLVELHIPIECLKLESIYIMGSKLRTLNLGLIPNLKKLSLTECSHLLELHAPIGCIKNLDYLDLRGCLRFNFFLFRKGFESLEVGGLSELHLIVESLDMCPLHLDNDMPKYRFACFYEEYVPSSIGNLEKLISFGLCACTNFKRFSQSICGLQCLKKLTLEGSFPEAPNDLDHLQCLEELSLLSTNITHLPDSICMLKHLKCLELNHCWLLEKLPEYLGGLECLEKLILSGCVFLRDIPDSICLMKHLKYFLLPSCIAVEKLPKEVGCLKCLKELNIEGTSIRHLPQSIFVLKGLRIVGFRWLLELCGFTSEIQISDDGTFCYIEL